MMQVQVTFTGSMDDVKMILAKVSGGVVDWYPGVATASPKADPLENTPPSGDELDVKTKRHRRTKAEIEAARAAEVVLTKEPTYENTELGSDDVDPLTGEPTPAPAPTNKAGASKTASPKGKVFTYTDLVKAFGDCATNRSRDEALAILAKYKVKSVKDIPEYQYPEVMSLLA